MSTIAVEFTGRVVKCQIDSGECTVCFTKVHPIEPDKCPNHHENGRDYGIVNGRQPFPVVKCQADGTRCSICGAQIDAFHCTNGHDIDRFYEIR